MWNQTKAFVIANAGTTKYLCLVNVRKGYGIGANYNTARIAWDHTQQHRDQNFPVGLAVPVFFNWTGDLKDGKGRQNYGHIAVRLSDGRFWTDGRYYASIDSLMSNYLSNGSPSYLGWGESVNDVRVVEYKAVTSNKGEDMIKPGDEDILRIISSEVKGWDFNQVHNGSLDAREMGAWKGRDFRQLIREGWAEGAWYRTLKSKQVGLQSVVDSLNVELGSGPTKAQLDEALAKIQKETDKAIKAEEARLKAMALAEENSKKYEEEKAKKSEDTKLLDSIGDLIKRIFTRVK